MASVEDASKLEQLYVGAKFIQTSPDKPFPFKDKQFNIVFCAAVIEHVGDYNEQAEFLSECMRVGQKLYLTTPNKNFFIEVHTYLPFLHWLPRTQHQKLLSALGFKYLSKTGNLNLLTAKTLRQWISADRCNYRISYNKLLGMRSNIILYVDMNVKK